MAKVEPLTAAQLRVPLPSPKPRDEKPTVRTMRRRKGTGAKGMGQ